MKNAKTETGDRFAAVRAAQTGVEYRAAIAGLTDELQELERQHSEAVRARDKAIVDGGDLTALRSKVADLAVQLADVRTAIAEATHRQREAEKREAESETADLHAEARAVGAELAEAYRRFDATLAVLREEHAEGDRLKQRLERINGSLEACGHPELRVKPAAVRESVSDGRPEPSTHGLSRAAMRVDELLRDLGTARKAIRVNPHHRRIGARHVMVQ
jgi:chromosome segregation ATPase